MKNNNTFKEYVAPIVVLVCICLVITAALAATYGVAKPIIDENTIKAANEARAELLPAADTFTKYTGKLVTEEKIRFTLRNVTLLITAAEWSLQS